MRESLLEQNKWWISKELIEKDHNIVHWDEQKYKWMPSIIEKIKITPFAFHIILGPRQVGKTTALKLLIRELLKKRNEKSVFYFNCEYLSDYKELNEVIEAYFEFREDNNITSSVILLDEITAPKEWYKTIKFLIDSGKFKNDVLIITGSTSLSIKKEIELFPGRRGNGQDLVMFPLSFREFLRVVNPELEKKINPLRNFEDLSKEAKNNMLLFEEVQKEFRKYLKTGGFPLSVVNMNDTVEAKKAYLSWVKNAVLKDGKNDNIARQIIKSLLEKAPNPISWEIIAKNIEIKSPKTVSSYIEFLKNIYSLIILHHIDISDKQIKFGKNKKIHFFDPLLFEAFEEWCLVKIKNKESILVESIAAMHIARIFKEAYYWRNHTEIDIIVQEKNKLIGFEVKWQEKENIIKKPSQLSDFYTLTKKEYDHKNIPLSILLSMLEV